MQLVCILQDKVIAAMKDAGKSVQDFTAFIGEKGPSGRAVTIQVGDTEAPAAELRLALGTTEIAYIN